MRWLNLRVATLLRGHLIASRRWGLWQPSQSLHGGLPARISQFRETSNQRLLGGGSGGVEDLATQKGSKTQYWIKQFPWSERKEKADSQYPFLDEESATNVRRMKQEIEQLSGEIRDMNKHIRDGSYLEPLIQKLPLTVQKEVRLQLRKNAAEQAQQAKEADRVFSKIEIKVGLQSDKTKYLEKLNSSLRDVLRHGTDRMYRMNLWLSYARCDAFLPSFLHLVPSETWDLFMKVSMTAQLMNDPHWASRRIKLYEDMRGIGRDVDSSQKLLYIEALNFEGHGKTAVSQWQDMQSLVKDNRTSLAHYELIGVDLFTSQGNPQRAEEIAFEYLAREHPEETRILVPILAAWLERGDTFGWKHAWALYLRMKTQLGSGITMNDYESVMMAFLKGGKTDLAVAVFKDMMLTGQNSGEDSLELFKKAVGLLETHESGLITVKDINAVALTSLAHLPRQYQNRFFYGKWLKKLISMGETDAAALVIELMYERGIKPDSKHMNGIIGAWLRSEGQADNEKAESMAWAMVHERLDFIKGRRGSDFSKSDTSLPPWIPFPAHLNRGPALATIETFSLLLHYYVNLREEKKVATVQQVLELARIPPNVFFMNHLLFHELLHGNLGEVWTRYLEDFAPICPSIETFAVLWDCEKKHLERVILKQPDEYPGPRLIMREMMNWFLAPARTVKEQDNAREDFSKKMYDVIIRCMCLAKDFEGAIVAIYALRDAFGVYPDSKTAKMITLDVARMGLHIGEAEQAEWKPRRHRLKRNPQLKANVANADDLFKMIWQQRKQHLLQEHGMSQVDVDERFQQEEGLFVLAEFLKNVLTRITPGLGKNKVSSVELNLKTAASSMGVGGIILEDPHIFRGHSDGAFSSIRAESAG